MIEEDQLQKLVQEFNKPRKELGGQSYHTRRREWFDNRMDNVKPFLDKKKALLIDPRRSDEFIQTNECWRS